MIGIIPAGGEATRIMGLPKMLFPTPKGVLIDVLCDRMRKSNPRRLIIMTKGIKYLLLQHLKCSDTMIFDEDTKTANEATLYTREFAKPDEIALFGMPDTYFDDDFAFTRLQNTIHEGADVAVGLFEARPGQHRKGGMCRVEGDRVVEAIDKPEQSDFKWIWGVMAWRPVFWEYIKADETHVGYGLPRAIKAGLDVRAAFCEGGYYDVGTLQGYHELLSMMLGEIEQ